MKVSNLCFLLFTLPVFSQSIVEKDENWILDVARSDEFNSASIDSTKWGHQLWFSCSREVAFQKENVSIENGILKISIKDETVQMDRSLGQCNRDVYHKTSGAIISKFEVGAETYVEFRVKLADYRADLTSAVWISDQPVPEKNPNLEIDLLETLDARSKPKWFSSAMHVWNNYGKFHPKNNHLKLDGQKTKLKKKFSDDFLILGLERRGDFVRMYVDGKLYWERNMLDFPDFLDQPRRVIVNVEGHDGKPKKGEYAKELLVDYIRTYTYQE